MDKTLFEKLLYEEESTSLDFKGDQYPFDGATHEVKSELLKDILAFANSWKRETAYILIGVDELKGGKSIVVGLSKQLDDAKLQQFVNSKVQKPITFSYRPFSFDGKDVGIIEIPIQQKPFYLVKNYGKLEKEKVYIRRGSSTDIAKPDEISLMGTDSIHDSSPQLELSFVDSESRAKLGSSIELISTIVNYDSSNIPRYGSHFIQGYPTNHYENSSYYVEMAEYVSETSLLNPVKLSLKNLGEKLASNVRVKIDSESTGNLSILSKYQYPEPPISNSLYRNFNLNNLNNHLLKSKSIKVSHFQDRWLLEGKFHNIQPKDEVLSDDVFYIGATKPTEVSLTALIFADNLPNPIEVELKVIIKIKERQLNLEELGIEK